VGTSKQKRDAGAMNRADAGRGFGPDETGTVLPFVVILFTLMVVSSGMAVDFMRQEMARADLQDALDRGVLAATNLTRDFDDLQVGAESLVSEYMKSRSYRGHTLDIEVIAPTLTSGRVINARASYTLDTYFLRIFGLDQLVVPVTAMATQGTGNIEISIILDVSGSMSAHSPITGMSRLEKLKEAASQFIDTVLEVDPETGLADPATAAATMISIIPYSGLVNLSDDLAAELSIDRTHDFGNCLDFEASDFDTTTISPSAPMAQYQHFYLTAQNFGFWRRSVTYRNAQTPFGNRDVPVYAREWVNTQTVLNDPVCPKEANKVLAWSNDASALKASINGLQAENWTAIYEGMKVGTGLLDPAMQPVVSRLIEAGRLPANFEGRPSSWSDTESRKVIVLMTDGRNTLQHKVNPESYEALGGASYFEDNRVANTDWIYEVDNSEAGLGDAYLSSICSAAKASANTVVYTIGFEIDDGTEDGDAAAEHLRNCASGVSTHYLVESVNIDLAFEHIAAQIESLKLIN